MNDTEIAKQLLDKLKNDTLFKIDLSNEIEDAVRRHWTSFCVDTGYVRQALRDINLLEEDGFTLDMKRYNKIAEIANTLLKEGYPKLEAVDSNLYPPPENSF